MDKTRPIISTKTKKFSLAGFFLVAAFILLSVLVGFDVFRDVDYVTTTAVQQILPRSLDVPFSLVTLLGSTEITLLILLAVFIIFLLKKRQVFFSLAIFLLLYPIELLGKWYIDQPLTPGIFHRFSLGFQFPSSFIVKTQFSYPSGHTARAAFLVTLLLYLVSRAKTSRQRKWMYRFLIAGYMLVVVVSRV